MPDSVQDPDTAAAQRAAYESVWRAFWAVGMVDLMVRSGRLTSHQLIAASAHLDSVSKLILGG